mgnify:CR=1 FL=1
MLSQILTFSSTHGIISSYKVQVWNVYKRDYPYCEKLKLNVTDEYKGSIPISYRTSDQLHGLQVFSPTWATPSMQSALCMLHASGEYTEHRDAMVLSFGMQGRAHSRRRSTRVVQSLQPWFTVFEVTQGLHWDQSMCWTETGWKTFLVGTLQQLELTKTLEFCLIKDDIGEGISLMLIGKI